MSSPVELKMMFWPLKPTLRSCLSYLRVRMGTRPTARFRAILYLPQDAHDRERMTTRGSGQISTHDTGSVVRSTLLPIY